PHAHLVGSVPGPDQPVELQYLLLDPPQLSPECRETRTGYLRNSLVVWLGVGRVILLPVDIGLHVGRRHQPHGVTKCLELARPMVRRGAGFVTDQTWR